MNKNEIIKLSSLTLVFVLTSLTLKELLGANHISLVAVVGLISGLFAFGWVFYLIRNKTNNQLILYTSLYCVFVLTIAFFFNREKSNRPVHITENSTDSKNELIGKWFSPSSNDHTADLIFIFTKTDSLIVNAEGKTLNYTYEMNNAEEFFVMDENGELIFVWSIKKLDSDSLVLGDGDKRLKYRRMKS